MHIPRIPHRWSVTPKRAIAIQRELAACVVRENTGGQAASGTRRDLHLVAGADLAFSRDGADCIAGVVVWDVAGEEVIEQQVARKPVRFPYVPGLLSFREVPALLAALRKLRTAPDAFIFDGQGYAHPRRFGLACHAGVILNRPAVGCAKSRLIGEHDEPKSAAGSVSWLTDQGERIGAVVRTRDGVKPVYVSVGHCVSLAQAIRIVLACTTRFRLPEPTRLADQLVTRARWR